MLPIWLLAAMMIMMYYWRFWEPCTNAMLVVLLPKLWFWIENHDWAQQFLDVFLGLTLAGPKKASKSTILSKEVGKQYFRVTNDFYLVQLTMMKGGRSCNNT